MHFVLKCYDYTIFANVNFQAHQRIGFEIGLPIQSITLWMLAMDCELLLTFAAFSSIHEQNIANVLGYMRPVVWKTVYNVIQS